MYRKYKNKKVIYNGIKFDSIKEYHWYLILEQAQKKGFIKELELQKKFLLQPSYTNNNGKNIRAIYYIADFFYYDVKEQCYVVEDTKGYKTDVYKLKKKIFEYVYPNLTIKEL